MKNPDIPIERREDDKLDREWLVEHLAEMLLSGHGQARRASRLTVGLTGAWGSGKSSVLAMLSDHLRSLANVIVIEFNPWVFQGREDLLDAFFEEVTAQLGSSGGKDIRSILRALEKYRFAIEPAADYVMPGGRAISKLIPEIQPQSALSKRRQLEKKLSSFKGAIVVLIDELDRVDRQEIRALARLTKAVVDLPNISYLISYDRNRVETALGEGDHKDGAAYLEKIVQLTVPLRPLVTDEVHVLLKSGLKAAGYDPDLGDADLMSALNERLVRLLDTPRDVKRSLSSFGAMEKMVGGEVNPVDVLGYAVICTKAPAVRDVIADDIDAVVNDAADLVRMMERRRDNKPSIEQVFGSNISDELAKLLVFLFPLLNDQPQDRERFGRIQDRRNLLTMLFLGDPPFQLSRKQVEAFWARPSDRAVQAIREKGKFGDFTGLLFRLLPALSAENDLSAWKALAREVGRGDASLRARGRNLSRDLRSILVDFGARGPSEKLRAQRVVSALSKNGDFALVPDIVRYHMFAHGLVPESSKRGGATIYDTDETRKLLADELPRYRKHVISGKWLSSSQDTDLLFALEQGGGWDNEMRTIAEKQLRKRGAVSEFAALFIPPGWSVERGTIERFVSEDLLRKLVEKAKPPADDWLSQCQARLKTYLLGKNPEFEA